VGRKDAPANTIKVSTLPSSLPPYLRQVLLGNAALGQVGGGGVVDIQRLEEVRISVGAKGEEAAGGRAGGREDGRGG